MQQFRSYNPIMSNSGTNHSAVVALGLCYYCCQLVGGIKGGLVEFEGCFGFVRQQ